MKPPCQIPSCDREANGLAHLLCVEHTKLLPAELVKQVARTTAGITAARKPEGVRAAMRKSRSNESSSSIARRLGISISAAWKAKTGRSWRNVGDAS